MNTKQTPGNNILTKLITNTIYTPCGTIAKLSNKKPPTQQSRSICFGTKTAITDIDEAKAFNKQFTNITPYSINKMNRHIRPYNQDPSHQEIQLTTTQVQLAILNSTNNNSSGPDDININMAWHYMNIRQ